MPRLFMFLLHALRLSMGVFFVVVSFWIAITGILDGYVKLPARHVTSEPYVAYLDTSPIAFWMHVGLCFAFGLFLTWAIVRYAKRIARSRRATDSL